MIKRLFHSRVLKHFLKDPLAVVGVLILFVMLIGAIFAPLIAPEPVQSAGAFLAGFTEAASVDAWRRIAVPSWCG